MSDLPAPPPIVTVETKPFWDGTARGVLMLPRCKSCGYVIWYPREFCPSCHTMGAEWFEASGKGTVYSFSITRRGRFAGGNNYVLAYVELDEGPRVMTNIVDCDPESVRIGQPVEVVFDDTGEGSAIPRFKPR